MGMRRDARKHDTAAVRRQAVVSEDYAEHRQGDRVITIDGPGRVVAVHDGPYPGSEEYEIRLEGGLGGGTYDAGQITASAPVEASVGQSEAAGIHLASDDYPELGTLLHDRPDPATMRYTATLEYQDGPDGGLSLTPAAPGVEDDEGQVMRDMGQYHTDSLGFTARSINGEHIDDHGSAPEWHRAANPNEYDRQSTEGEPDPAWIEDVREKQRAMASHPDDGAHEDEEFDEGHMCAVGHDGPCPGPEDLPPASNRHTAMPSKYHPRPEGFHTEIHRELDSEDRHHSWNHRKLVGYLNGDPVGSIDFHLHPNEEALKVNMLHTHDNPETRGKGVASAMMDDLYTKHPHAWINHGWRTQPGRRWWRSYQEPEGHEDRNVHNVHPDKGWKDYFSPYDVADDIGKNEDNDPGHHTEKHPVVDEWRHDGTEHEPDDDYNHDLESNRNEYSEGDEEYCNHCGEWGDHPTSEHESYDEDDEDDEDEEEKHDPDPRDTFLHHGTSLHLSSSDHAFVHNPELPTKDRAARLLDIMGRGNMPTGPWHPSEIEAREHAWKVEDNLPTRGVRHPATNVVLHAVPFDHDEVHEHDSNGTEHPQFQADGRSVTFRTTDNPVNFGLHAMTWGASGRRRDTHSFDHAEPVGMPLENYRPTDLRDFSRSTPQAQEIRSEVRRKHEERYRTPDRGPLNPPGTGEQMELFQGTGRFPHQRVSSLPSITADLGRELNDAGFDVVSHKTFGPMPEDPDEIVRHLVDDHGYTHDQLQNLGDDGQGDELMREHELEHDASTYDDGVGGGEFGAGEQGGGTEHKHGPGYNKEFAPIPHLEHPIWGGAYNPEPGAAENAVTESVPAGVHSDDVPRHPWALSMLVTAAQDPGFRFHVTAGWRDVQAKAKRIRSQGGVSIKHSDGMTVVADVRGDHNVYETALQRAPGRRQSVAVYACGCKWGAYHWGASDDLSRFAGRMCSHALALQYEAASRGMFGRDVEVDDARPRWVPSKVVVKYDIDTGQSIRATASVPEQPPILVALALMEDGDPAARVVTAAVNDMFGDTSGYSEPSLMDPLGPTVPWNKDESPASAGNLSGGEPSNWGSITGPTMLPRVANAITTEAFWQAIVPLVRAVAPKLIEKAAPMVADKAVNKAGDALKSHQPAPMQETQVPDGTENGAQATLHDEPEGALPETDGDNHTASLGDVDIVGDHDLYALDDDALSPESPSIQTQGTADIVADFQRSAAARTLMDGGPAGDKSNSDIARAAEAYLSKTAGSTFTRAEQDALIHESPGVQASNTDRLDIVGTHYADLDQMDDGGEDDALWLM